MVAITCVQLLQLLLGHTVSKIIGFEIGFHYSRGAVARGSIWTQPIRNYYTCAQKLIAFMGLEKI